MNRITEKMLQARIDYLNEITGNPAAPYIKDENGRYKAQIGNYHLSHAYGGVCVHQISNEGGGVREPLFSGYGTKRGCFEALCSFISGYEACKRGE